MIKLGKIEVKNRNAVVEARNKIRILARDLHFDAVTAARLAAVTSELSRNMSPGDNRCGIIVELDQRDGAAVLVLKYVFTQFRSLDHLNIPAALFDSVAVSNNGEGPGTVEIIKILPDPGFKPTKEFIAGEREMIGLLTREELFKELKEAYAKLQDQSAQLIQTEKMGTIGTMAAGIAHELNNPIMGMLNYVQYCLRHTADDNKIHPVLLDTEKEIRRCIDIVNNLLTFSYPGKDNEESKEKANPAAIIERVLKLLSYKISKNHVTVIKKYVEHIPAVFMNENKIQQVFLNLINNALDALKDRDRKEIHIEIDTVGNSLRVTVADTGCGIQPENLGKIFDPFFTTREVGKGTGLGLSVAQSIIQEHGGKITCESEVARGAVFTIFLPKN